MKNIVVIGGGTGTSTLLEGLKRYPVNLSVIVSTADDGGSTGRLRRELGVVPPGDIRQCLLAMSEANREIKELFAYRFNKGEVKGHTVGNIVIASLEKTTGNINQAIEIISKILKVHGQVVPVTTKPTNLSATLSNGKKIIGEHNLDEPAPTSPPGGGQGEGFRVEDLRLTPNAPANPKALQAIKLADIIIFGPGDLFTSTLPNLLVKGVKEVVNKSPAKKIFITNIMTKFGQTDGFKVADFMAELKKYLSGKIDIVIANNKKPSSEILKKYRREKSEFIEPDTLAGEGLKVIAQTLISKDVVKKQPGDTLKRSLLRHDSKKLAKLIWGLI